MAEVELRIGDAEREEAASALSEHFAKGRLTLAEHAERLDRVWAARTHSDLAPLFADLPGRPSAAAPAPGGRVRAVRRALPPPVFALLAVLVVLTVLSHLPLILVGLGLWWCLAGSHGTRATAAAGPWGCRTGR